MKNIYSLILVLLALTSITFGADYYPSTSGAFSNPSTWSNTSFPGIADNIVVANGDANIDIELSADRTINNFTINSGNIDNLTFSTTDLVTGNTLTANNFDGATAWNSPGLNLIIENGITFTINGTASCRLNSITVKNGGSLIINNNLPLTGHGSTLTVEYGGNIDINGTLSNTGGANTSFIIVEGAFEADNILGDGLDFAINDGGLATVTNDATFKNPDVTINSGGTLNVGNNIIFEGGWPNIGVVDGAITAGGDFYIHNGLTIDGNGSVSAATYDDPQSTGTLFGIQPANSIANGTSIEDAFYSIANADWDGGTIIKGKTTYTTWSRSEGGAAVDDYPEAGDKAIITTGFTITSSIKDLEVRELEIRLGGKLDASKEFTITDMLDVNNQALIEINKSITIEGDINLDGTILAKSGDLIINSNCTFTGGGVFDGLPAGAGAGNGGLIDVKSNTNINGTGLQFISKDADVMSIDANITATNSGNIAIYGNITTGSTTATWINAEDSYLEIEGDIFSNTTGVLTANAINNTVLYSSLVDKEIKTPSGNDFYNLTVSGAATFSMVNNLNIAGDLNISGSILESAGNNLDVEGNWISSGTFTSNTGTNTVTFSGANNQNISKSGGETFYDVIIDKSAGTVTIDNDITISGELTLANGNFVTGNNTLELGTDVSNVGTLTHDGNRSWVNGNFKRWVTAADHEEKSILFPIGTDTYYRPATPIYKGISGNGSITASFVKSNPGTAGFNDGPLSGNYYLDDNTTPVFNTFIDGYWDLNSSGVAATSYIITLDGEGFDAFTINDGTRLLTRTNSSSDWTADGDHTPPATGDIITRTNLSTLPAQFCFADTSNCSAPSTLTITGNQNVCTDDIEVYNVTDNSGSVYTWTIKNNGGTITAGQGSHEITVNWGSTGKEEQITVVEENNCTIGEEYTLDVNIHSIKPVEIIGDTRVAAGQTGVVYSVQDYTDYDFTWSVTEGTITDNNNDNITVTWDNSDGIGSISVYAEETTMGCAISATIDTNIQRFLTINSFSNGEWDDDGSTGDLIPTWDCYCVPSRLNSVKINHDITTNNSSSNIEIKDLIIETSGTLDLTQHIIVKGDFNISGSIGTNNSKSIYLFGIDSEINGIDGVIETNQVIISQGNKIISSNSSLYFRNNSTWNYGKTIYNYGSVTFDAALIGGDANSIWINEENSTLSVGNTMLATGKLYASSPNNTVKFIRSSSTQTIREPENGIFYNLVISGGTYKNQSFNMTVLGDLTNIASLHNTNNNDITIAGNWTNTGTFNEGTGTVTFNGSSAQSINNYERFYNLVINNTNDSVTMADDVTVTNSLTLTTGNILMASGKKLDLNSDNFTYSGGKIVGQFERTISSAGTKLFPVGTIDTYNPINFDLAGTPSGTIRSEFIEGDPGGTYAGLNEDGLNITGYLPEGYWETFFSFNPGTYNMDVTGDGIDSIISATRILNRINGNTAWTLNGTHANAVGDICYRTGVNLGNNTYEFALGKTDCETFTPADSISGLANVCKNDAGILYSIPDRGNNYQWTVVDDLSHSGEATNELTVNWGGTALITGRVSVVESNSCYVAPAVEKSVWVHSLPTQNLVGPDSVFDNTNNWAYAVDTRTGYTYDWSVTGPDATTISGDGTGNVLIGFGDPGTYTITVDGYYGTCSTQKAAPVTMIVEVFSSYETQANTAWNIGSTWVGGAVPPSTANAKILHNITIPTDTEIKHLIIDGGSITQSADFTVTGHYKNDGTHNGGGNNLFLSAPTAEYTISGIASTTNFDNIFINNSYEIMTGSVLSMTANAMSISNGYAIRNKADITLTGNLIALGTTGQWINDANSSLTISGNLFDTQGELYAKSSGNTITYSGTAQNINISENGYWNLATSGSGTKTLTGITEVFGDLTIGASTTLDASVNNYTLQLEGDWNNSGTFNEQLGSVQFLGEVDQNITSAGDEGFYDLVISLNSGLSTTLNSNIVINNDLRLTRGTINTNGNMVIIEDNATTNGGDADSFVEGDVQKNGDDDFIFPLGDSITWARLGISFATPAPSEFIASYGRTLPVDTGNVTGMNNVSSAESWDLHKVSGNNVYLTLYCEDTTKSGIDSVPDLKIAHYSGGTWIEENATATISGAGLTITTDNVLTSYSPFTFGSGEAEVNPLPIELIYFNATPVETDVTLSWATASEKNNDFFTIERSYDGINFEAIIKTKGTGNSTTRIDYSETDTDLGNGTIYYRLKQTDYSGEYSYSQIVSVTINNQYISNDLAIKVYPNPYSSGELVIKSFDIEEGSIATISITDIKGNKIFDANVVVPASNKTILNQSLLENLSDGVYVITLQSYKGVAKQLLVIE